MTALIGQLEEQTLLLSETDRMNLVKFILSSLSDNNSIENAWILEITRRINDIESGQTNTINYETSLMKAQAAIT